jgi:hypothetical protein
VEGNAESAGILEIKKYFESAQIQIQEGRSGNDYVKFKDLYDFLQCPHPVFKFDIIIAGSSLLDLDLGRFEVFFYLQYSCGLSISFHGIFPFKKFLYPAQFSHAFEIPDEMFCLLSEPRKINDP